MASINIAGADVAGNNTSGNDWLSQIALSTQKCKVFSVVAYVPAVVGADQTICLYDSATAVYTNPLVVINVGYGLTGALDLGSGGIPFNNGCYMVVTATAINAANTTATPSASANSARVTVGLRKF